MNWFELAESSIEKITSIKFRAWDIWGSREEYILFNTYNIILQIEVCLFSWISTITQISVDFVFSHAFQLKHFFAMSPYPWLSNTP